MCIFTNLFEFFDADKEEEIISKAPNIISIAVLINGKTQHVKLNRGSSFGPVQDRFNSNRLVMRTKVKLTDAYGIPTPGLFYANIDKNTGALLMTVGPKRNSPILRKPMRILSVTLNNIHFEERNK